MKSIILCFLIGILSITIATAQETRVDEPLGLRIKRNGTDYLIYVDKGGKPDFKDSRKLNYQVYFRIVNTTKYKQGTVEYTLISIPGSRKIQDQKIDKSGKPIIESRNGRTIGPPDYDQNFWIKSDDLKDNTEVEYFKFANNVFSGLLTAPFKYRLKAGSTSAAMLDGDFNIAPFIGWKWRVSSRNPYYIAPFGFAGITSLSYNSANNSLITDADKQENGTGLTYGLGLSFKFGAVSPGFVLGWDKGFGNLGEAFSYNNRAWISFSVNYDFFKPEQTSEGNQ
ncbi:MAG: hypothetical protein CMB99_05835 [Flavobacteriaceae bacterium]|nr:hypothetical protein [Flavobacteriaceae bacterium]|tara:strand:+ start:15961 stop:16806 length:846 start_codon:yes stop_codon:yes gene_type:complete